MSLCAIETIFSATVSAVYQFKVVTFVSRVEFVQSTVLEGKRLLPY